MMDVIHKTPHDYRVPPNLSDYEQARAQFRWSDVPALCEGMGENRCNIGYAALDRHVQDAAGRPQRIPHCGSSPTKAGTARCPRGISAMRS
ncbi:acetate-CoA ligase domain protein [Mycobacterium kansasii]|uniref:Acetate-CoA ligase domain protein n=1 Tax=Mycobacterium kansasii TaxID=1768 RepID=A0A1V3X1C8_MYCKA|nr:acetate-CoA ligase domain protein [Mycobacterium kansasii]